MYVLLINFDVEIYTFSAEKRCKIRFKLISITFNSTTTKRLTYIYKNDVSYIICWHIKKYSHIGSKEGAIRLICFFLKSISGLRAIIGLSSFGWFKALKSYASFKSLLLTIFSPHTIDKNNWIIFIMTLYDHIFPLNVGRRWELRSRFFQNCAYDINAEWFKPPFEVCSVR